MRGGRLFLGCVAFVAAMAVAVPARAVDVTDVTVPPVPTTVPVVDELLPLPVPLPVPTVPTTVPDPVATVTPGAPGARAADLPTESTVVATTVAPAVPARTATPPRPVKAAGDGPVALTAATRTAAKPFAVPLLVMASVLVYLVMRGALDRRDRRLAAALVEDRWVGFR